MKIDIITLFPGLFAPFREWSMIKKAQKQGVLELRIHNLRKWAIDKRGTVDDHPYGGGPGMLLRIEPIYHALQALKTISPRQKRRKMGAKVILLSAKGETFNQKMARQLANNKQVILICGHYEGVDERVRKYLIDADVSIGNYVLSGGELAAMVVTDAISRLLPGVLNKAGAHEIESFSPGLKKPRLSPEQLLEFPQYTRPPIFKHWSVPKVLRSGNHQAIQKWREKQIKIKND